VLARQGRLLSATFPQLVHSEIRPLLGMIELLDSRVVFVIRDTSPLPN
jgi:hypothetical protein